MENSGIPSVSKTYYELEVMGRMFPDGYVRNRRYRIWKLGIGYGASIEATAECREEMKVLMDLMGLRMAKKKGSGMLKTVSMTTVEEGRTYSRWTVALEES